MLTLYRQFGLDVVDFADTNDFLLAAFKEPLALTMSLVTIITAIVFLLRWTSRRRRTSRVRPIYYIVMFSFMLVYTFFPPLYFGRIRAMKIKYGEGKNVIVELRAKIMDIGDEIFLLGTTEKFAFFYNYTKERTYIVPIANILNIYSVPADSTEVSSPKNNNSGKSKS